MKLKKFNQFVMNEEYKLPIERSEQQLMIKEIAKSINPNFNILFDRHNIHVSIDNRLNQSGKFENKLDIHKVSDSILQLIQLEKEFFKSGIINEQTSELVIDYTRIKVTFSILV